MQKALAHPELISLAAGFVDQQTLPVEATQQAMQHLLADPHRSKAALQYGATAGHLPLREQLLERFLDDDAATRSEWDLSVDQVVLTAGSNQLLHLASVCLLSPGDIVLCSSPTYFVYLAVLKTLGARAVGVEMDQQGIIPESLEEQLVRLEKAGELDRVKAIYVVDYFDNPCSATLSLDRRPKVVELAKRFSRKHPIYVIEDSAYRELRYQGEDLPSLRAFDQEGDTVLVAQTFSKSFSPGIRVGWGILPPKLVGPLCDVKGVVDFGSPHFAQHLMSNVLELGLYEPHIALLRQTYAAKMQAMLSAADEHLAPLAGVKWSKPTGGLYVWLTLPEGMDARLDGPLFNLAMEEGILYVPGEYGYPADGRTPPLNTVRLSFGVQTPDRIRLGMAALARAIRRVQNQL